MADKYAHLRPFKSRDCYREDGIPKRRYEQADAEAQAACHEEPGYHAYRCPECRWWHVGRKRDGKATQAQEDQRGPAQAG